METIHQKFGQHSLKGVLLPDGRFIPDFVDAARILLSILGIHTPVFDPMPKGVSPLNAIIGFSIILDETKDRPETIEFKRWLDGRMRGEKECITNAVIAIHRHFGWEVTADELIQILMDDPDTCVHVRDNTTWIYTKEGDLLAKIEGTGKEEEYGEIE